MASTNECPVCFNSMTQTAVALQPCMHHLCKSCAKRLCDNSDKCPKCRVNITNYAANHEMRALLEQLAQLGEDIYNMGKGGEQQQRTATKDDHVDRCINEDSEWAVARAVCIRTLRNINASAERDVKQHIEVDTFVCDLTSCANFLSTPGHQNVYEPGASYLVPRRRAQHLKMKRMMLGKMMYNLRLTENRAKCAHTAAEEVVRSIQGSLTLSKIYCQDILFEENEARAAMKDKWSERLHNTRTILGKIKEMLRELFLYNEADGQQIWQIKIEESLATYGVKDVHEGTNLMLLNELQVMRAKLQGYMNALASAAYPLLRKYFASIPSDSTLTQCSDVIRANTDNNQAFVVVGVDEIWLRELGCYKYLGENDVGFKLLTRSPIWDALHEHGLITDQTYTKREFCHGTPLCGPVLTDLHFDEYKKTQDELYSYAFYKIKP